MTIRELVTGSVMELTPHLLNVLDYSSKELMLFAVVVLSIIIVIYISADIVSTLSIPSIQVLATAGG